MGRKRTTNRDLPTRVYLHHGAFYYRPRIGKPARLGTTKADAIVMFLCVADERDIRDWKLRTAEVPRATTSMRGGSIGGVPVKWLASIYRSARKNALARKLPFHISIADVHTVAARANGKCEFSGMPFSFDMLPRPSRVRNRMIYAPSLDRRDATRGYSISNIRLVSCAVNICLQDWGDDVLRSIAISIVKTGEYSPQVVEPQGEKILEVLK